MIVLFMWLVHTHKTDFSCNSFVNSEMCVSEMSHLPVKYESTYRVLRFFDLCTMETFLPI